MTTWILLRGLMREARHWGDFPKQLQQAVGAERLLCLDFPGNGRLHEQDSLTSVEAMADFCHAQLTAHGIREPVQLLAISLGAMVALAWMKKYPEDLLSLMLINTSVAPHNPFYHRLRPGNYPGLIATMLFGSHLAREELILRITSNLHTAEQANAISRRWLAYAKEMPISRRNIVRQLFAALRFRAPLQIGQQPILLLAGEKDRLVNVACSRALAHVWNCDLRLHTQAGHDLPLDDGAWVIRQVLDWQQHHDPSRSAFHPPSEKA